VGQVPRIWKTDNKIFFEKKDKDNYNKAKAYRGISLESIIGKMYERIIKNRLYKWMEDQGMLDPFQFAYRNDKSISQALLAFTLEVIKAMKSDETCIATFIDLEGAFDAVWRNGLVYKLYHAGIRGRMLLYVYSYLKDRVTRIIVNGYTSEWIENLIGVPQGSIIAPLLFIFYISEMTNLLNKRVSFADDLTSWVIKSNIADACDEVKLDFLKLTGWTRKWRMSINAGKTDFILFGKHHQDIVIQVDSTNLPQVKSKKLLGVIIQEDLSYNEHVDSVRSKCFKAQSLLNPLMSSHNGAPAEIGIHLFRTCTRAIIESSFPVWCNISPEAYKKIEEMQRIALKSATGTHHNTALSTLEVMTGVPPLRLRLEEILINEFTRILSKEDSDPVKSLILTLLDCKNFMDSRMLSPLHLVKPLFKELGIEIATLEKTIEPAPKIKYDINNTALPEFVRIDKGDWGSSNSRTNTQKEVAKETTKEFLLNNINQETLPAFLDGSALGNPGPCGASAIIYTKGLDADPLPVRKAISPRSTSYHGELAALLLCVTTVLTSCLPKLNNVKILHIFSDCQSAIKSVMSTKMLPSHQHIKDKFLKIISELLSKGIRTKISWVAGHVDLTANEMADMEAKKAAKEAAGNFTLASSVTRASIKAQSRQRTLKRWQKAWKYSNTGREYCELHPKVKSFTYRSQLPSYKERLLLRLRSKVTELRGETRWKKHVIEDYSEFCECGQPETVKHVLLECSLLTEIRDRMENEIMLAHSRHNTPYYLRKIDMYSILEGESELDIDIKTEIDRAVANFLLSSKRQF
jgi:ribonuclease HI